MHTRPLPPELQGRPFTSGEARSLGVGNSRLKRHPLHRPARGVWVPLAPEGVDGRCQAVMPLLPSDAAFSHETAAALLRLPLPPRLAEHPDLHVTTNTTTAQRRRPGWVGHRGGERRQIVTAHGVPVVGPLDTWCDLGAYAVGHRRSVTVGDLVMIGDAILMCLLETQHPLASREESRDQDVVVGLLRQFTRVLARRVRPRGKTALATAYDLLRVGVRSPQESRARVLMVLSGLPEPAINVPIHSNDGSALLAEGDLVWDTEDEGGRRKVVGEYQGAYHAERDQRSRDSERSERLRDHGWTVHEIWAEDINQVERRWNLVLRIARSLGLPPSGLTPIRWL